MGFPGNSEALKRDFADLGVFDDRMSLYLPFNEGVRQCRFLRF